MRLGWDSDPIRGEGADGLVVIDLSGLYAADGTAKLARLPEYEAEARRRAGRGKAVKLTGPVCLSTEN